MTSSHIYAQRSLKARVSLICRCPQPLLSLAPCLPILFQFSPHPDSGLLIFVLLNDLGFPILTPYVLWKTMAMSKPVVLWAPGCFEWLVCITLAAKTQLTLSSFSQGRTQASEITFLPYWHKSKSTLNHFYCFNQWLLIFLRWWGASNLCRNILW